MIKDIDNTVKKKTFERESNSTSEKWKIWLLTLKTQQIEKNRLKTAKDSKLGDGKNYPECRTGIKRWKYEKKIETDGISSIHLTGIPDKKKENNIWRDNGYEFFWVDEKH